MADPTKHILEGEPGASQLPPTRLVLYVMVVTVAASLFLIWLLMVTPDAPSTLGEGSVQTAWLPASTSDVVILDVHVFLLTAVIMLCCGVLGGCLYDIRGLIKHSSANDFESRFILSYYLRPFAGALSGLIVFFLLLGGALAFNIAPQDAGHSGGWKTFAGRMPYITFGLLAGYSSHAFMMKLKDIADAMFSTGRSER